MRPKGAGVRPSTVGCLLLGGDDPLAVGATRAVQGGELEPLRALPTEHPGLANAEIGDHDPGGMCRSLLQVATRNSQPIGVCSTVATRSSPDMTDRRSVSAWRRQ